MSKNSTIEKELSLIKVDEDQLPVALREAIEKCFHLPDAKPAQEQALEILETLLAPVSFKEFVKRFVKDPQPLISALIYGLYYKDFKLQKKQNFYSLFQIFAETYPREELVQAMSKLSFAEQIRLIAHIFANYREGSFLIQREIVHPKLKRLTKGLEREFYSIHQLEAMLYAYNRIDEIALNEIIKNLEAHADEECKKLHMRLQECVQAITNSSLLISKTLSNVPGMPNLIDTEDVEIAKMRQAKLESLFQAYLTPELSPAQIVNFARVFGLGGSYPVMELEAELSPETTLLEKVTWIRDLFLDSFRTVNKERKLLRFYTSFIMALLQQIHAMHYRPQLYLNSLERLVFAMPTKGKDLSMQGSLDTILDGLKSLTANLEKVEFVVFDQSDEILFQKNAQTLAGLNERFKILIKHFSLKEAFALAEKLGLKELFDVSETGHLGYSGVRNAVFLLCPMVGHDPGEFKDRVLGPDATYVCMFDDDNVFPASNIFCYLMFIYRCKLMTPMQCYNVGRYSKLIQIENFSNLVLDPTNRIIFLPWITHVFNAAMAEYLGRPKIGLNVPMGSEEGFMSLLNELYPLIKPSIHISGTRFPKKVIPTRAWVGLEQVLNRYLPYAMGVALVGSLTDSLNRKQDCAYPWNDTELNIKFRSLDEVLKYMILPETQEEMKRLFWGNLNNIYHSQKWNYFRDATLSLINEDIDGLAASLTDLTPDEKQSLDKIAEIYKRYQLDAKIMWEYGERVDKSHDVMGEKTALEQKYGIPFKDLPFTLSLYLLCKQVGMADFNQIVSRFIESHP